MVDGNGRSVSGQAGRLLLNWQLLRAGFPLTVIQVEDRARYLGALDQGHAGQQLELQTLVADAVELSLRTPDVVENQRPKRHG
jgi:Fic family protein